MIAYFSTTARRELTRLTDAMLVPVADKFLDELDQVRLMLTRFPDSGWPLGRPRRRKCMVGNFHVLTYERTPRGIEIKRVLDGRSKAAQKLLRGR